MRLAIVFGIACAVIQAQESQTVTQKLQTLRMTVSMQDMALKDAIDWYREATGCNILLDKDAQAKSEEKISLVAKDIRAQTVLNLVLQQVELGVRIQDGILIVTTKENAIGPLRLEIYDVRSLCFKLRDLPGVEIEFGEEGGVRQIQPPIEEQAGLEEVLEELVRTMTGRKAWDEIPDCSVQLSNGLLVVRQTEEMQKKVQRALLMLGN